MDEFVMLERSMGRASCTSDRLLCREDAGWLDEDGETEMMRWKW
ncbi:MAG: hypothetical protein AB4050_20425 [Synechococcus sp.]